MKSIKTNHKKHVTKNNKTTIMAHCVVFNEERWVWYAINSVINYVDKILIYDTGSTDRTVEIIQSMHSPKITLEKKGRVSLAGFTDMRQEMLARTDTDWFFILDGDDVWPEETIRELREKIVRATLEKKAVVVGFWSCVGDIFHYSEQVEKLVHPNAPPGVTGWMATRALRTTIPGLHYTSVYGLQGLMDEEGSGLSEWGEKGIIYLDGKYFHMSYLPRSSSREKDREVPFRSQKTRFYKGAPFPEGMKYPEVFYKKRPAIVPSPWKKLTLKDELMGLYYRTENFFERLRKRGKLRGFAH